MRLFNSIIQYAEYTLHNSQWWFGFFIGALMFLIIGFNWHLMTRTQEWYACGAIAVFCLIGVLLSKG